MNQITQTISAKELRMNFPQVIKKLKAGESFTIIYRSKPVATLEPVRLNFYTQPFGKIDDKKSDIPKNLAEFMKDIDKYSFKGGKKFDAVKLIRKDRGYED